METNPVYSPDSREEIIDGKTVLLEPQKINHSRIYRNLIFIFDSFPRDSEAEYFQGTGLFLEEDREEYLPDGMVVCDPEKVRWDGVHGAPDLVVEVLSKSTARYDRGHKKDVYEKHGVREYWIVDPFALSVEQYILTDGKFDLRAVYHKFFPWELERMKPEERAEVAAEFRCSLFDDLTIRVEDIFARVVPD